jgi:uncharacterized lipoprotein YbaY
MSLVLATCALVLIGCAPGVTALESASPRPPATSASASQPAIVRGTVTYRQSAVLSAGALITVQLVELSEGYNSAAARGRQAAAVLGEQVIAPAGENVPVGFEIQYDLASVKPNRRYGVAAHITVGGSMVLPISTTPVVMTPDPPPEVEVLLAESHPWPPVKGPVGIERLGRFSH